MYTLGISCYYHDSAAALLKDGKVISAVEEERFSRKKFDDGFPELAIKEVIRISKIRPSDIDRIAIGYKEILLPSYIKQSILNQRTVTANPIKNC